MIGNARAIADLDARLQMQIRIQKDIIYKRLGDGSGEMRRASELRRIHYCPAVPHASVKIRDRDDQEVLVNI